jgi:hypothetical protein
MDLALLPKIILDTSAINALEDRGADAVPLMRRLAWDFEVILTFTNLEELLSTPSPTERSALLHRFDRLRRPGRCIVPPCEIFPLMMASYAEDPTRFDWTNVDVRVSPEGEALIAQRDFLDDTFCEGHRAEQQGREKEFKQVLKSVRPALDEIPVEERPSSYEEFVAGDESQGKFVPNFVRGCYRTVTGNELTEMDVNEFVQRCAPVRALALGQLMGFYGWSLRGQRGRKDPAGRNDLAMAAYLPYSDFFLTQDGPQKQALSEVASEAEIVCRVLSLEEFQSSVTG